MGLIGWSHSLLEASLLCRRKMGYMLDHVKPDITFGYFAEGIFLHSRAEKFYKETWNEKKNKPKYKSAEGYGGQIRAWWLRGIAKTGMSRGRLIEWYRDNDKYKRANSIKSSGITLYNDYFDQERPLMTEEGFDIIIILKNKDRLIRLKGYIDEIRRVANIVDIKTGFEEPSKPELENGRQLTFYLLGTSSWIAEDEDFSNKFGISKDERKRIMEDPLYVSPEIKLKYYLMKRGKPLIEAKRNSDHVHSLLEDIIKMHEKIVQGDFDPNIGGHCKGCVFKYRCAKEGIKPTTYVSNVQLELFSKKPSQLIAERMDEESAKKLEMEQPLWKNIAELLINGKKGR